MSVRDWAPQIVADLVGTTQVTGTVTLSGRLAAPRVEADVQTQALEAPAVGAGAAHLRATYEDGEVDLDEFTFESPQGRLQVQGRYTKAGGLDFTLPEARADLSLLSSYLQFRGVTLSGPAVVKGSVKGPLDNPAAEIEVTSSQFRINDIQGANLDLATGLADGQVTVSRLESEFGGGRLGLGFLQPGDQRNQPAVERQRRQLGSRLLLVAPAPRGWRWPERPARR